MLVHHVQLRTCKERKGLVYLALAKYWKMLLLAIHLKESKLSLIGIMLFTTVMTALITIIRRKLLFSRTQHMIHHTMKEVLFSFFSSSPVCSIVLHAPLHISHSFRIGYLNFAFQFNSVLYINCLRKYFLSNPHLFLFSHLIFSLPLSLFPITTNFIAWRVMWLLPLFMTWPNQPSRLLRNIIKHW